MRKLSLIAILNLIMVFAGAQENPHGEKLTMDCTDCHTTDGWKYSRATSVFNHDLTKFKLEGQHIYTNCVACHTSLVFSDAKSSCVDCHADMHNTTVGTDCSQCHNCESWIVDNITEIHQMSRFPLLGAHNTASCSDCHTSASQLEFEPLGVECIDCHQQDYMATTNPNHVQAGISTNCIECHKIEAFEWSASGINHDFFPLSKGHESIDCATCHATGTTEPISADCYSCHQNDYNSTTNPSHQNSGFTTDCIECHTTDPDWKPAEFKSHDAMFFPIYSGKHREEWNACTDCHTQSENFTVFSCIDCHEHNKSEMDDEHGGINGYTYNSLACFACHPAGNEDGAFNHNSTNFQLIGAHISTGCLSCHTHGFSGTSMECNSCHSNNYSQAANPNHVNAGIAVECGECHTEDDWNSSFFDHTATTSFELSGGHSGRQCSDCHVGTTTAASSDCISCHQTNYNEAENHITQNYPYDCLQCHNNTDWGESTFDHNATNFPLTGSHIATECAACHTESYTGTSTLCSACHQDNYNEAQNPGHTAAGISTECETCHETAVWNPSIFDHTATTSFELSGGHSGRQCSDCHVGTTTAASSDCISCHQTNFNEAENHVTQNYPYDCLQCHNNTDWGESTFDHNATNFPLTGSHIATECAACHTESYTGTSTLCSACHQDNYNEAQNPSHTAAGISTECETCHETTVWNPSVFDHTATTSFELSGGHSGRQCSDCHVGTTTAASSDCISCHQTNYNEAENHITQNYPYDCLQCHNNTDWGESTFDHNATNFPLTSSHIATECAACHTESYAGTSTMCSACHQDNYNEAQNPSHTSAGISTECETCHETTVWNPSIFDHTATTSFELSGGHSGRQCSDCHVGTTTAASPDCISCHQTNYNEAENHITQNYPYDCLQCHNNTDWGESTFDHNATNFPLTGSHIATECAACHTESYAGTSTLCSACHQDNYNESSNPNHNSLGISTNCEECHTTNSGWEPALLPNHREYYVLNGAHAVIASNCYLCHEGNYTSTSNSCFGCHSTEYNNTTDPAHAVAQFSTDCMTCHTENAWEPSAFDHDNQYFPINSGKHQGKWDSCTDCHTESTNYSLFSCTNCHEHNITDMSKDHSEVSDYVYNSVNCLACHPIGESNDDD